jgi:hypothetical protein
MLFPTVDRNLASSLEHRGSQRFFFVFFSFADPRRAEAMDAAQFSAEQPLFSSN